MQKTNILMHAYRFPYKSNSNTPGNAPGLKTKDFLSVLTL